MFNKSRVPARVAQQSWGWRQHLFLPSCWLFLTFHPSSIFEQPRHCQQYESRTRPAQRPAYSSTFLFNFPEGVLPLSGWRAGGQYRLPNWRLYPTYVRSAAYLQEIDSSSSEHRTSCHSHPRRCCRCGRRLHSRGAKEQVRGLKKFLKLDWQSFRIHRLEKLLDHQCTANTTAISSNQNFSSSSASSMIAGATSTSTPTSILYDPFKDHIIPSSNCSDMGSTYISAGSKASFTIHCETDFRQGDIMGVWVFTFADCMEACAAYNNKKNSPPCYAVSYDPEGDIFTQWSGFGNCFLKGSKDIPALSTNLTSSAVFNFDS